MQATMEDKPPAAPRQRHLPRVVLDVIPFLDFMASLGFDSPAKVARELGVLESIISRLKQTNGRISIDFMGLLWAKYPDEDWNRFLIVPGIKRRAIGR